MSNLRWLAHGSNPVVAILCSDIHLQEKPPTARSTEPDWYKAMARPLLELSSIQKELDCPVICAGDIFDKWNPSPELINFAIDYLPDNLIAIPGQHDLKYHIYKDIKKTGYWTLVKSGKMADLRAEMFYTFARGWDAVGFSWGHKIRTILNPGRKTLCVAHQYIWESGPTGYKGAPEDTHISKLEGQLVGYTTAVFGDNHIPFANYTLDGKTEIFNCGSLMRRTVDQKDHKPRVGLLHDSGHIRECLLDISKDKFLDEYKIVKKLADQVDLRELVKEFKELKGKEVDFISALQFAIRNKKLSPGIRKIVKDAMARAEVKK